jgi:hypothetical protein
MIELGSVELKLENADRALYFRPQSPDFTVIEQISKGQAGQVNHRDYNFAVVNTFCKPDRVLKDDPLFEHNARFIAMAQNGPPPGFTEIGKLTFRRSGHLGSGDRKSRKTAART